MRPIYFAQKCPQNVGNAVSETPNSKHFQGTCPRTTLEMCRHFSVIDAPLPLFVKAGSASALYLFVPLFCLFASVLSIPHIHTVFCLFYVSPWRRAWAWNVKHRYRYLSAMHTNTLYLDLCSIHFVFSYIYLPSSVIPALWRSG